MRSPPHLFTNYLWVNKNVGIMNIFKSILKSTLKYSVYKYYSIIYHTIEGKK